MALYTVILKLGQFTHVSQIRAESASEAFREWGHAIVQARAAGHPVPESLSPTEDPPEPQLGTTHYWQATVTDGDRLETVHLIHTYEPPA